MTMAPPHADDTPFTGSSTSHSDSNGTTVTSIPPSSTDLSSRPVVCVFCGASPGTSPAHLDAARALAQALHNANLRLVYGGGTVGIMGEVARTLVQLSGPSAVHGIIPSALLKYERDHKIDESLYGRTTVVPDMHTRKHMMAREVISGGAGGGFVALSGGYGTLEELMEVVTWNQLGIHKMGIVVFNVEGYWDGLLKWVNNAVEAGFVSEGNRGIMVEARTAEDVVTVLREYQVAPGRFKLLWDEN